MNAQRPPVNKDASKIPPAENLVGPYQPHDNMAPFSPAPVKNATDGGSHMASKGLDYLLDEEEGTGRS
jgi:hypothetical protein